jgi:hypothetical protein
MRYNYEIYKEFNSPNAVNVTKTNRLRYAGYMISRPEEALFKAKPQWKEKSRKTEFQVGGWDEQQ